MIVSASFRTDIPAFYGRWFLNRLAAGSVQVRNPYGGRSYTVDLTPAAVDGYVFWTRNAAPFFAALAAVAAQERPFVGQFTVLGYPRALDRSVIEAEQAVAQIRDLRRLYGPRAVVWRYDPIVLTDATPPEWHRATFARLAGALAGLVDEAVVSFVEPYRKTARNLAAAARRHGLHWRVPEDEERRDLIGGLAGIAAASGMALTLCTQPALAGVPGTAPARCVDAERLAACAGRPVSARVKGNRPGCLCHESRDIGAYDSCPHGCVYCYAVSSRSAAQRRFAAHDPHCSVLIAS